MGNADAEGGGVVRHVFFVENGVGEEVAGALERAGCAVERHLKHLAANALDPEWIGLCSARGWVAFTKDRKIGSTRRYKHADLERKAVYYGKLRMFTLRHAGMRGPEMAALVTKVLPAMLRILSRTDGPFIARIHGDASVEVWKKGGELIRDDTLLG